MCAGCRNATIHRSVNEIIQLAVAGLESGAIDAQACAYFRQHFFDLTLEVSDRGACDVELLGNGYGCHFQTCIASICFFDRVSTVGSDSETMNCRIIDICGRKKLCPQSLKLLEDWTQKRGAKLVSWHTM